MNRNTYLEVVGHYLKDVVTPFVPTVTVTVHFGNHILVNGSELKPFVVQTAPRVVIGGQPNELYTLVMVDPDAPNPNEPYLRHLVSWIVTNIPGGTSCAQGTEIESYVGPNPQIGMHRYVLILYRQQAKLNDSEVVAPRVCFDVGGFATTHNLGDPVGLAYFTVRKQPNGSANGSNVRKQPNGSANGSNVQPNGSANGSNGRG